LSKTRTKATSRFVCPECPDRRGFRSKSALTLHMRSRHGGDELARLRAEFGVHAPQPGGAISEDRPLQAAPSGVPSIDWAIGIGGLPRGTIIEIFGPPRAGKTLTALTFAAHSQQQGGRAGLLNVERAPMQTFLQLIPGLDKAALEYGEPANGTQAMEMSRRFLKTGQYDIWGIDSVHACIPDWALEAEIGSSKQRASVAQLMSEALPVLAHIVSDTHTACILINHVKQKPGQTYGRDWYTPGGSAPEYYASTRLHVWASGAYMGKNLKKQIGHRVKVKVEKSKVTAPFTIAEFDLYYAADTRRDNNRLVTPGIDVVSSWMSVLHEERQITRTGSGDFLDIKTGERLGTEDEVREMLVDPRSELALTANKLVYPEQFR
jgi:recombination protein RecA